MERSYKKNVELHLTKKIETADYLTSCLPLVEMVSERKKQQLVSDFGKFPNFFFIIAAI